MEHDARTLENQAVEKIFAERKDFIIIGLTGRTGCGCSTVGKLLSRSFEQLQPPVYTEGTENEKREYKIIYEYAKNTWMPFRLIEMKHVIFTFILEHSFEEFCDYITNFTSSPVPPSFNELKETTMKFISFILKKSQRSIQNSKKYSPRVLIQSCFRKSATIFVLQEMR